MSIFFGVLTNNKYALDICKILIIISYISCLIYLFIVYINMILTHDIVGIVWVFFNPL